MMIKNKTSIITFLGLAILAIGSQGCLTNGQSKKAVKSVATGVPLTDEQIQNPGTAKLVISAFNLSGNGDSANVLFNSNTSTASVPTYCNTNTKLCVCRYSWEHINTHATSVSSYTRIAETQVTGVQTWGLNCDVPEAFTLEIPVGAEVKIEVYRGVGNPSVFTTNVWKTNKGNDQVASNFSDSTGNLFHNIKRYACFEKINRATSLKSGLVGTVTSPNGNETLQGKVPLANRFCTPQNAGQNGCPTIDAEPSAQTYYYNLFTSASSVDVAESNDRYYCPRVEESIGADNQQVGQSGYFWPYDRTFALAIRGSKDFSIPVEAPSVLGGGGSSAYASTSCTMSGAPAATQGGVYGDPNSISKRCVGWAKKPNSDGSCSFIIGSDGKKKRLYRLRRFIAEYPAHFDSTGKIEPGPRATDIVYVIDRPIKTADPNVFYTMMGPKPCPFAYYDKVGLGYAGTNNTAFIGRSPDGLYFPNKDDINETAPSCSAAIPIVSYSALTGSPLNVGVATTHSSNEKCWNLSSGEFVDCATASSFALPHISMTRVPVRPIREPFWPHYVEDTAFEACAPLAEPFVDAPLTVYRPSATAFQPNPNWRWCAQAYPTRNGRFIDEHQAMYGNVDIDTSNVREYATSHRWGCEDGPLACLAVLPPPNAGTGSKTPPGCASKSPKFNYDPPGPAVADVIENSCDRTAILNDQVPRAPLLAPLPETLSALRNDDAFSCALTWDNGNGNVGKSPSTYSGCCRVLSAVDADDALARRIHVEPKVSDTYDGTDCPAPNISEIF